LEEAVQRLEERMILEALDRSNWVQTDAARLLGIDRKVLKHKMDKLKIKKSV